MFSEKKISDEDFVNNYSNRNKDIGRSDRYVKGNSKFDERVFFSIFLGILYLIAYYLFSKYIFIPFY
jgi:hypothetical protein